MLYGKQTSEGLKWAALKSPELCELLVEADKTI